MGLMNSPQPRRQPSAERRGMGQVTVPMQCVQCGRTFENSRQYVFQGGWRHKPQCRAWKACEARLGHTYDRYLNLIGCTRTDCPGGAQHPVRQYA